MAGIALQEDERPRCCPGMFSSTIILPDLCICTQDYCYLVPDETLAQVSDALIDLGLPHATPRSKTNIHGEFDTQGRHHRLTRDMSSALMQNIVIYPQSFSTLYESELEEVTPNHITSPRCSAILAPTPPAVYASLIRMMLRYTRFNGTMYELQSDLSELIGYHLLKMENGYIDVDDDGEWEKWQVERRISDAVHLVRSWGVDSVWREGEDWIGDALAEIVRTGAIENLPCC